MAKITRPGSSPHVDDARSTMRPRDFRTSGESAAAQSSRAARSGSTSTSQPGPVPTSSLLTVPGVVAYDGFKNLSIGVWVGQATLAAVNGVLEMSKEMEREYPEGRSSVVFVLDQVAAPTPEAQERFARVYEIPGLACLGVLLEGTGFWASGIRSMTNNLHRGAGSGTRMRVHTGIDELLLWLPDEHRARTGVQLRPEELRQALLSTRVEGAERALHGKG